MKRGEAGKRRSPAGPALGSGRRAAQGRPDAVWSRPRPLPESVAAVDLGSNSFHMIVARGSSGELVVVDRLREMIRLASGLDERRNLVPEAQQRALDCLRRFGQRVAHFPAGNVRAVGTNTLRRARNATSFLDQAGRALGHPVETISGIEEARLIYVGAYQGLQDKGGRRLVLDIGGGSTEVIIGESIEPLAMESLFMGCVSTSREFFPDDEIDARRWRRARLRAFQEFEPIRARYRELGWDRAIGTSGTIRAVDAVVRAAGWDERGITIKSLERLRDAIIEKGCSRRLNLEGLSPERRPVFAGGVVLLLSALETLGIDRMEPSDGALREGLLHDLIGRIRHEDVRDRSVGALAERHRVDPRQAARVKRTALTLLDQVAVEWKLTKGEGHRFLSWGARLHEIGLVIAHAQQHKHGEYMVAQSDLMGFSRDEQQLLATLVRAHRRRFPVAVLRALRGKWRRQFERLSILLRLAVILHRSRSPTAQPVPRLSIDKKTLRLEFPSGWLDRHPLTRADLEQEKGYLAPGGYQLEFD